ncbi:MAG: hypothetical protein HY744_23390 [Deltaproteobacteria bacterium]|nr:hypothetical protein [Deltaproteobacteria bacterium]
MASQPNGGGPAYPWPGLMPPCYAPPAATTPRQICYPTPSGQQICTPPSPAPTCPPGALCSGDGYVARR